MFANVNWSLSFNDQNNPQLIKQTALGVIGYIQNCSRTTHHTHYQGTLDEKTKTFLTTPLAQVEISRLCWLNN
jgi:hypothetical protein